MSRTHKRVRLNRGGLTGEWAAVRVNQLGAITDRWPLHEDDAALLERWRTAEARLAAVEALADEWERELDEYRIRDENARYCWATAAREVRAALAAPTDTTKETDR